MGALTPLVENCKSKNESIMIVKENIKYIESVANQVLQKNGFDYLSNANIKTEEFPTRSYGDTVLESGIYDALIINLGTGTGDNWWCVVYPPLCFVNGNQNISGVKSRIVDFFDAIFA